MHQRVVQTSVAAIASVVATLAVLALVMDARTAHGLTANNKFTTIVIKATNIEDSGFTADECLISTTNTLARAYSNISAVYLATNESMISNNNWCERSDDSVAPNPDSTSNGELSGLWVTWDTNFVYVAVRGQAKGRYNNLLATIDTAYAYGNLDFLSFQSSAGHWRRDILFDEGINPNIYLGFWCKNDAATYDGTDIGGNTHLRYGNGVAAWTLGNQGLSITNEYFSWYNGSVQADPAKRLWIFRVKWGILTNNVFANGGQAVSMRVSIASTGPDDGSLMYDYMPETQYAIAAGATHTIQNNYFTIPLTDGSGAPLIGVSPRNTASINLYPGARYDRANFSNGIMPIVMYNDSMNQTKAFTPNGDSINDSIKFSFFLKYRAMLRSSMWVYDLKGRKVRTLFTKERLDVDAVTGSRTYNGPVGSVDPFADSRLSWDGKDDNGAYVPMGIYIVVFEGEDGSSRIISKRTLSLIR